MEKLVLKDAHYILRCESLKINKTLKFQEIKVKKRRFDITYRNPIGSTRNLLIQQELQHFS
jgi:hypothetical protein